MALLDLGAFLDAHLLDPAGDLGADHRLVTRLQVTLGAEKLFGLAGGHRLHDADGNLGLGAELIVLPVAVGGCGADQAERDQPDQGREQADAGVAVVAPAAGGELLRRGPAVDLQGGQIVT
jgi:hypothetical protein